MLADTAYRQCSRCVLDTTSITITFDENGVCNYCHVFEVQLKKFILINDDIKKQQLDYAVNYIKKVGKYSKYDCILGLSGGVDSSYMAYFAKQLGLRPMTVHFDNGWNSEYAVQNIEKITSKLGYDLQTYVMDWDEFKDVQLSYLKASVVDIEVPTDQLTFAALNRLALKNNIRFILSGYNIVTEFGIPADWVYKDKSDQTNLINIHKKFGRKKKLKHLPKFDFYTRFFYKNIAGINTISLLDYINFNKKEAKQIIEKEFEWKDHGGKHFESVFTRFYQGYILPKKFNIDKRKAHLSALICSGQIKRDEALQELMGEPYDIKKKQEDKEFLIKKMELTAEEFENIMKLPRVEHERYGTEASNKTYHRLFELFMFFPVLLLNLFKRAYTKLK